MRVTAVKAEGVFYELTFEDGRVERYSRTGDDLQKDGQIYRGLHSTQASGHIPKMCPVWLAALEREKAVWKRFVSWVKRIINRARAF